MKILLLFLSVFFLNYTEIYSCTIFTVSKGDAAFCTGNDDYITTDSIMWVDPPGKEPYGVLFFGDPNNIQQGYNEAGLAYDSNGLPKQLVFNHHGIIRGPDNYTHYSMMILKNCRTVEEVISWVNAHCWPGFMHDQMHFADADGNAVVISAGSDGKLAFTRKQRGDSFLISTNFNLADTSNGKYPCDRYETAEKMLKDLLLNEELNVEKLALIAEGVSVKSPFGRTLYSRSIDLKAGRLYLYYMFQYRDPVVIDIKNEIRKLSKPRILSSLFRETVQRNADKEFRRVQRRSYWVILTGLSGLTVGLILFKKLRKNKRILTATVMTISILAVIFGAAAVILAYRINSSVENPALPQESCTTVMFEKDGMIALGDNEDAGAGHPLSLNPDKARFWICPSGTAMGGRYGCLWFGWPSEGRISGQSGMNGAGLSLGLTSVKETEFSDHPERLYSRSTHGGLYYRILWDCKTVEEAVEVAKNYNLQSMSYQILLADKNGNAAVLSPGDDGEITITQKENYKNYLAVSTINLATGRRCGGKDSLLRLNQVNGVLKGWAPEEDARAIMHRALFSAHREKHRLIGSYTMYSVIFYPEETTAEVYFLSDYKHSERINFLNELENGYSEYKLSNLFEGGIAAAAIDNYYKIQSVWW